VFLNGRPIRDKTIQHALREAYRGLIEPGRYPTCVLMIEMDPGAVDVNVHPAKTEVRFRDQSMVHQTVLRAVKGVLQGADLTPRVESGQGGWGARGEMFGAGNTNQGAARGAGESVGPKSFVEFFRRDIPSRAQTVGGRFEYQKVREAIERVAPGVMEGGGSGEWAVGSGEGEKADSANADAAALPIADSPLPTAYSQLPLPEPKDRLLQVHNSFVVTQDADGLLIVDQHALHERVMFEVLMARIVGSEGAEGRPLESQAMLVPAQVRVARSAAMKLEELRPILDKIGIQAELLSPEAIGVQAFPSFLFERGVDPGEFIAELFERAEQEGFAPASEQALSEVLDMMACKAAVKAGDRMSDTELGDLLKLREMVERSASCPHGRPTSIRLTIRELEKRFGRG
jgi:DNA mismatch repair protein MutL